MINKIRVKAVEADVLKPFLDHLRELRTRLLVSVIAIGVTSVVSFIFYNQIITFLFTPFELFERTETGEILFVNTIFEGFITKVKVALLAGAVFSMPVHFYNLVSFVFPGLTAKERKVIIFSLCASFILVGFSAYYSYYKVIPISVQFLTSSGFIPKDVGFILNFGKNIFYIFRFLLVTLILFQLPIVLEVLLVMGLVKRKTLLRASRYIIVLIFVLSATLTPPDFISQVSLALPLIVLYFLTILIARLFRFGEG